MVRKPFTREQVKKVIRRECGGIVPLVQHKWWGDGLEEALGSALEEMAAPFPDDVVVAFYQAPGEDLSSNDNPRYRWGYLDSYEGTIAHSIGRKKELLQDWGDLPKMLADFPNPYEPSNFDQVKAAAAKGGGRYLLGGWWYFLHERMWSIRGMEHLMLDYYDAMEELKVLGKALVDYYKAIVDQYAALGFDGIFTSDDLGHQRGPMMSPACFRELYFPLYQELIGYVHQKGMDFFLHSCGDNTLLMEMLIEAGVDVFHPVQKGCMDWEETARIYGGRISFLAGFDVQHTICQGTPQQVREEVRRMKKVFGRPEGGLLLGAGNGILPDTPLENIRAMLDEMSKTEGAD